MSLENEVTEGLVTYIHSIVYNSERKTVIFEFRNHPEEYPSKITKLLSFSQVEKYSESWLEEQDLNYIEQILFITETSEAVNTEYVFTLSEGEIIIRTAVKPYLRKEELVIPPDRVIKGTLHTRLRMTSD